MDSMTTLDEPTQELTASLAATSTDRCPSCGSRMAPDQRYCVECGERRTGGGLRDALPRTQAIATAPAVAAPRRAWLNPNSSLIAGVATLLLAMGVGVLIGKSSNDSAPARSATPQVVTVSAGAAGPTAATTTTDTSATGSGSSSSKSSKKKSKGSSKPSVSGASSVQETAKKNGVKLPPKVVKVGQKCEKGAKGCQGGKFTGNFFGGG